MSSGLLTTGEDIGAEAIPPLVHLLTSRGLCCRYFFPPPTQESDSFTLLIRSQVRVPHRHGQRSVPKEFAHGIEIDVGLDQARGEVVTKVVPAELLDLRCFQYAGPGGLK